MNQLRISKSSSSIIITFILIFLMPASSLLLTFIFHNDITIDKPKVIEESLKGIVSLLISVSAVLLSNSLTNKRIQNKINSLNTLIKYNLRSSREDLLAIVNSPKLLSVSVLEKTSADNIRLNSSNEQNFKNNIQRLLGDLNKIYGLITLADPEIAAGCNEYLVLLLHLISTINDYLLLPNALISEKIKLLSIQLINRDND